ncbi:hypothetical protein [Methyloversatilis discipulorum]|jgi:hypothetical protein|uniref:hypothetical protein n=1 Tax=Methyloversatilis discipulorum TaxID=1119528 RepID=UPI0012FA4A3E|nr:hypothetical protein [Methyloversatilis discipulorum]
MAAILLLEDGRALDRSNLGFCGMLVLISKEVADTHARLKAWLADKAERTSPFCEFDLRGLSELDRIEFWAASERAYAALLLRHGAESSWPNNMYAGESLSHLLQMHRSIIAGEPPSALNDHHKPMPFRGQAEDLDEIWFENGV